MKLNKEIKKILLDNYTKKGYFDVDVVDRIMKAVLARIPPPKIVYEQDHTFDEYSKAGWNFLRQKILDNIGGY